MPSAYIDEQVRNLPPVPGVYLFKGAGGDILYVGKATSLRQRVASYFGNGQATAKTRQLVSQVNDLEYFVTGSEQEALILELNLIKRHHPHYNIRLKDDKGYPYLKIDIRAAWPRLYVTRRLVEDGGRYFGPFTSAGSVRQTLKAIKGIFPLRSCTKEITGKERRPCLEFYIGRCVAPCTGATGKKEYAELVGQVILFLEGKQERLIRRMEGRMQAAAAALEFEKAGALRDQVQAIRRVIEEQRLATRVRGDLDAAAFVTEGDQAFAQVFFVRGGRLIGREGFLLQGACDEAPSQIMTSFVKQFYNANPYIPPRVLLQHPVEDGTTIRGWLAGKRGGRVDVRVPRRGERRRLMEMVASNAAAGLAQLKVKQLAAPASLSSALDELKEALGLPQPPGRIEGYDISDIQGTEAVGSMVVFDQGRARPGHYRRFRIKTVPAADDYAMLREVLRRRFRRAGTAGDTWAVTPDLVLIDGGRGQLNAALEAITETGAGVPVASLAKEQEAVFTPRRGRPLLFSRSSPALQLLQRVRDEAHRFALGYHRQLRRKRTFASALDGVPGIGPRRKQALLRRFGAVRKIKEASVAELAGTPGMSLALARKVKEQL